MSFFVNVMPKDKIETNKYHHSDIIGFKMQPLIELHSSKIVAYEMLSLLSTDNIDAETFFQQQTKEQSLALFRSQFSYAKALLKKNPVIEYWINLPVEIIADSVSVDQLCALVHERRIAIEIQDPVALSSIDAVTHFNFIHGLSRLKKAGWMLCMDDITPELTTEVERIGQIFKGIKTCRSALPATDADVPAFVRWVVSLQKYTSVVVVEGIETWRMRNIASLAGADLGQGFLWKQDEIIIENTPGLYREKIGAA